MARLFEDELHNDFGTWPLGTIPAGGADFGEVEAVAEAVGDGDDGAFHDAWIAAGDRLAAAAEAAAAAGHEASARSLWLRAATSYGASFHPIYGAPVDPRIPAAFRKEMAAFEKGSGLAPLSIPFEGGDMPAYLLPAEGREDEVRPLVVFTNGYDGTIPDMYFASAVAASRRGYHSLMFDGPGQGAMLIERNVPLRPDWETVVRAVVDVAVALPTVDPARIALSGWSLGGHLAPRGASGEPRLAALIADPGTWCIADGFRAAVRGFGVPEEAAADLRTLDQGVVDRLDAFVKGNRLFRWKVVQRGFWTHGVDTLRDYLAVAETFTLDGRAARIACPTLVTQGENDPVAAAAGRLFDALACPKRFVRFTAAEGAGDHCEMRNRSLMNRVALDWLDEVLAP